MHIKILIISLILSLIAVTSAAGPQGPQMSDSVAPLSFRGSRQAVIGLYIEEIATGNVVAEYGADRPMCPASILKAVTSASVMTLYAPDRCFITNVGIDGTVESGTLQGNLIIRSSGDPTLGSANFDRPTALTDSIISSLRSAGIDSIAGSIIIDEQAIPDPSYPPGWGDDDFMWPYGAMLRSFNWRDNSYTLRLPSRTTEPHIPGLTIDFKRLRKGAMHYDAKPPLTTVKAWGRPPAKGAEERLAMPLPSEAFIYALTDSMTKTGIGVGSSPDYHRGDSIRVLTSVLSPAFPEILQSLMHRSDNLFAEGMLRTIAPFEPRDTAVARETLLWKLRGADVDSIAIIDGSGLSRLNRVTPWFISDVLLWMARSDYAAQYASLFPRVGIEGTVKRFLSGTRLEGRMALKTGSMRGVRALAGYKFGDDGHPTHTVVLIVNDYSCSVGEINKAAEAFFLKFFS